MGAEGLQDSPKEHRGRGTRREPQRVVLLANLAFLATFGIAALALLQSVRIHPLTAVDPDLARRIQELELALQRDPASYESALELARLYQDVGDYHWSYDALRRVERSGEKEPRWRLRLGMAYLEMGWNKDALRVIEKTRGRCQPRTCPPDIQVRLDLFQRVVRLFIQRRINSRQHPRAADRAMREIFKPIKVDPLKMRPKGPAPPPREDSAARSRQ